MDKRAHAVVMRFEDTPATIEFKALEKKLEENENMRYKIEGQLHEVRKKMEKEHEEVADRLDKEMPDWRTRLVLYTK